MLTIVRKNSIENLTFPSPIQFPISNSEKFHSDLPQILTQNPNTAKTKPKGRDVNELKIYGCHFRSDEH